MIMMMLMRMMCLYAGGNDDYDENDNDDDAPMSLKCRMSESIELLAHIDCQFKMMKSLQDAECQDLQNCMHISTMRQTLEDATCQNLQNGWHSSMRQGVKTRWKMPLLRDRECKNSRSCFAKSHLDIINAKNSKTQAQRIVNTSQGSRPQPSGS